MPYVVPNAVDTVTNPKYLTLDQAEPDSLDFEVLGDNTTGVIFDCEVTYQSAIGGLAVDVNAGVVLLKGTVYTVQTNPALALSTGIADPAFELIVARLTSGVMIPTVLLGTPSNTNPAFPTSLSSSITTSASSFNPATDVLLAAIYRSNSTAITEKNIVDKRKLVQTAIPYRSSSAPLTTDGSQGVLYFRTGTLPNGESGLYVKKDSSTWVQLATAPVSPGVPIGTVITWVVSTPPDASLWLECNGSTASISTYQALSDLLGTTYGPKDVNTFTLPNFAGMYLAGQPSSASAGVIGTADGNVNHEVKLVSNNLPLHQHGIDHGHSGGTTGSAGGHDHKTSVANEDFAIRRRTYAEIGTQRYVAPTDSGGISTVSDGFADKYVLADGELPIQGMSMFWVEKTAFQADHAHSNVGIPSTSGLLSAAAGLTTPIAVDIQPRTMYVKYYIRAL